MHGINNHIKDGTKVLTHGYQKFNTSKLLIFDEYVKMRESLYTRVIIWVNTILNHMNNKEFLPRYEGSCMVCRP